MQDNNSARTIDITPTWSGILNILIAGIQDGTPEGQRIAREELSRMAQAADAYNNMTKDQDNAAL